MSRVLFALAVFAAACVLGSGHAVANATTGSYSATGTDTDIRKSCKNLSVANNGTLSGTCNKVANGAVTDTVSTTHDLTTTVACHNVTQEPFWAGNAGGDTNYTALASGQAKSVSTGSGNSYYLIADCGGGGMELPLSRRIGNKTSDGVFEHSSSNLW